MKPDNKTGGLWLYALGLFPVIWLALLIAPSLSGGLSEILEALPAAMNHPFQIVWCEDSGKAVLIFMAAYGLGIGIYLSSGALTAGARNTVPPNGAIRGP